MIHSKKNISQVERPAPDISTRNGHYRFDRNERTTLFTEEEFAAMISVLNPYDFVAYGELEPFYVKTANWLKVDRENILLTSGSDMGIKAIFETFIDKDDEILITVPNYAMFSVYTQMFGGIELLHFYEEDLNLNVNNLLDAMTENIKLIVISNPGHTGKTVSQPDLLRIIEKAHHQNTLILIDEAYFHFYNNTMLGYINRFDNLIISRTFSKAFGLASLRIGILIACKTLIDELYRVKLIHEITGVAAKIGAYLLDNIHIVEKYVTSVNDGKSVLYKCIPKLGGIVYQSDSNFVFFKMPTHINTESFTRFLEGKNIYIKGPFREKPLAGLYRVTAGNAQQMELFCTEIVSYYKSV